MELLLASSSTHHAYSQAENGQFPLKASTVGHRFDHHYMFFARDRHLAQINGPLSASIAEHCQAEVKMRTTGKGESWPH